ncbi:hypothetical protein DFH09DRAFT_1326172 [Mycena vulgaris]|nr:hypothetical protein DFH09DRAFT_1326172 [Mycena vulgaris]
MRSRAPRPAPRALARAQFPERSYLHLLWTDAPTPAPKSVLLPVPPGLNLFIRNYSSLPAPSPPILGLAALPALQFFTVLVGQVVLSCLVPRALPAPPSRPAPPRPPAAPRRARPAAAAALVPLERLRCDIPSGLPTRARTHYTITTILLLLLLTYANFAQVRKRCAQ